MLGKTLKYELQATGRLFLPCFAGLLGLSLLCRLFWGLDDGFSSSVAPLRILTLVLTALLVLMFTASVVVAVMAILSRFYKNLLSNEGYLMHALPVHPWQHVLAKLLSSLIWVILSFVVAAICGLILTSLVPGFFQSLVHLIPEFWEAAELVWQQYGGHSIAITVLAILAILLVGACTILQFYTAMSFGQRANSHKVLASVGVYILISIILQVGLAIFGTGLMDLDFMYNLAHATHDAQSVVLNTTYVLLGTTVAVAAVIDALLFWLTTRNLSRHLNLQ